MIRRVGMWVPCYLVWLQGVVLIAAVAEDPAREAIIAAQLSGPLTIESVKSLKESDRDHLVRLYGKAEKLTDKRGLIWGLARVGDGVASNLIQATLVENYRGRTVDGKEESVLIQSPLALGMLAARQKPTYEFLRQGTDPAFWKSAKTWNSQMGEFSVDMMTHKCIQGLGLSGRTEFPRDLQGLMERTPNYLHRFGGSVVEAAFYFDLRRTKGEDSVWDL